MKWDNRRERLRKRVTAWQRLMDRRSDFGVEKRKDSGGYKCPGSMKR